MNSNESNFGEPNPVPEPQPQQETPNPNINNPPSDRPKRAKRRSGFPPEFENFNKEQIEFINDLLHTKTYTEVQEIILQETGVRISINKLFRYREKLDLAECLQVSEDANEGVQQLINLYQGHSVDLDQAGLETIKRRALALACSPSTRPSVLLQLMRIFTWQHRKSMDDHRKQMDDQKVAHRDRMARIAEKRAEIHQRSVECRERRAQLRAEAEAAKPKPLPCPEDGNLIPYLSEESQKILAMIHGPRAAAAPAPQTAPANPQNS